MLAALALQVTLGISTLLSVVALPLAAAHQAGAVLLYTACLWTARSLGISAGESQLSGRADDSS
jgi:cytochrome c oxidase assembly protein subunit 15